MICYNNNMDEGKYTKLNISEITPEATISIVATYENRKIELPTEYAHLSDEEQIELEEKYGKKILPLENILKKWQDKLKEIDFKGTLSKLNLVVICKEGIFHWENVKIAKYTFKSGKAIHIVVSRRLEGERYNRRRGVRINIDKVMDVEQGDKRYSVIVRDLSYCGVAFVEPLGAQLDTKEEFILHLIDKDDEGNEITIAKIRGRINNQKDNENGGVLNGCTIAADHAAFLQKYIATKQIEAIRGKRPGKKLEKNKTGEDWKEKIVDALNGVEEEE